MSGPPLVSVLVPVLDEAESIHDVVAAMRAQRLDGETELIFVDGGSRDGTRATLESMAAGDERVHVLDNPERRTPNALNIGLAHARGEFVARMDAHALYPPDYLQSGIDRLRRGDVDWVSGPQLAHGAAGRWSRRVELALRSPLGVGGASFRSTHREEIDVESGFTGVWRRDTLERYGGWDEGWPINQDAELAARVREAGGRIVCVPEMAARYLPRDSLRSLARQYWGYGHYRAKTAGRHPETMRRSHVLAPGLVLTAAVACVPVPRLRRVALGGLAVWGVALGAEGARQAAGGAGRADAAGVPLVLATMHGAWGAGFIAGCARFGLPGRALTRALLPSGARSARR